MTSIIEFEDKLTTLASIIDDIDVLLEYSCGEKMYSADILNHIDALKNMHEMRYHNVMEFFEMFVKHYYSMRNELKSKQSVSFSIDANSKADNSIYYGSYKFTEPNNID